MNVFKNLWKQDFLAIFDHVLNARNKSSWKGTFLYFLKFSLYIEQFLKIFQRKPFFFAKAHLIKAKVERYFVFKLKIGTSPLRSAISIPISISQNINSGLLRISGNNSFIYLSQHILAQHIPADMFLVKKSKQLIKNFSWKFRILNALNSDV